MFPRLLTIGSALVSLVAAFAAFTASAEASYYYDESAYNRPTPCYQYDGQGHCVSSGTRYRARTTYNRTYNGSAYNNQYPYGYTNYGSNGYYRPVDNYYPNRNNGCYWYYGSYRCDNKCNH
ncbi:MAG: hypothetical protein Greene041662_614 [Candidatus Peregrinibacteria bacterium Greene0416_62]|nr:MAG: hypothetical protein Greene041662_614 [Candidatus Peregrinibacteria bacterium Greene0416_62]TSD00669.1 MAG: hypothetical protein Greene101449_43 [Candidatus Peregrinibacteria bacterium Greene1014_49]